MPKMIQLRNVPDALHRKAKVRAASAGLSLSDYLTRIIREDLQRPTDEEIRRRLAMRPVQHLGVSAADFIREARDERDQELWPL